MNVNLTPELEKFVGKKVATGLYGSASEVIREALRMLSERDRARRYHLEALRRDIAIGIRQADQGRLVGLDTKAIRAKGRRLARRQK